MEKQKTDIKSESVEKLEEDEEEEEEEEDLFNKRIDNSGCAKEHYSLQVS